MLGQARPLVDQLPEGVLREQVETDLAQRAGMPIESLKRHWGRSARAERAGRDRGPRTESGSAQVRSMAGRRTPPQTATLLDRACWLLASHADLWHEMPAASHELLGSQPTPYGPFIAAIERLLHDHGPMALPAVLDALAEDVDAETIAPLMARLRQFHDAADGVPADDLAAVVHQLKLRAIADELNWLLESGDLSDTESARFNELTRLRDRLKTQPPASLQVG
jgi:DNA primase